MEAFEQVEILLVEDNPQDAELTMRALKKGGLANKLLWVKDGQQALDYLFRQGIYVSRDDAVPRLVLLDLKMPRVDGIEVLKAIKADDRTRRIPVVIMTSSQEGKDVAQSYELGVNSYVVKPVEFNAFADVARQAGYYWLAINRTPST
ncbi:MAG: response regulator [Betaproteobacteria bacterium]|nr:response regulator [Betaproteobacteria bacterium]